MNHHGGHRLLLTIGPTPDKTQWTVICQPPRGNASMTTAMECDRRCCVKSDNPDLLRSSFQVYSSLISLSVSYSVILSSV